MVPPHPGRRRACPGVGDSSFTVRQTWRRSPGRLRLVRRVRTTHRFHVRWRNSPMRQKYLRDCQPGDVAEDVFVISGKQLAAGKDGKHYIKAFISDRTAQVTARMWNATRDIFNALPDGGFVRLRGRVENYQNNLQIILEQTWPAKEGTFE